METEKECFDLESTEGCCSLERLLQLADKIKYEAHWFELITDERIVLTSKIIFQLEYESTNANQRKILRSVDIIKVSQLLGWKEKAVPLNYVQGTSHLFFHKDYWELSPDNKKMIHEWMFKSAQNHSKYEVMLQQMSENWLHLLNTAQLQSLKKLPNLALAKKFYSAKYLELSDFECSAITSFKQIVSERLSFLNEAASKIPSQSPIKKKSPLVKKEKVSPKAIKIKQEVKEDPTQTECKSPEKMEATTEKDALDPIDKPAPHVEVVEENLEPPSVNEGEKEANEPVDKLMDTEPTEDLPKSSDGVESMETDEHLSAPTTTNPKISDAAVVEKSHEENADHPNSNSVLAEKEVDPAPSSKSTKPKHAEDQRGEVHPRRQKKRKTTISPIRVEQSSSSSSQQQQISRPVSAERPLSPGSVKVLPKPKPNPSLVEKFEKKFLHVKELLIDILRLEAEDGKHDPLLYNIGNALKYGIQINGFQQDIQWIHKLQDSDKCIPHILEEMEQIIYRLKLALALFEYKIILQRRARKDPSRHHEYSAFEIEKFVKLGKFSSVINSPHRKAVQHLLDDEAVQEYGLHYDSISNSKQQRVLKKFSICQFHSFHLSVSEASYLFFRSNRQVKLSLINASPHAACCIQVLRDLLCKTTYYKTNDLKYINTDNFLSNAEMRKYAAMKRLTFKDFHKQVEHIEPYLSVEELKTLHLSCHELFQGRLKHLIEQKKHQHPLPKFYFSALFQYKGDELQMKQLQTELSAYKAKQKPEKEPRRRSKERERPQTRKESTSTGSSTPKNESLSAEAKTLQEDLLKLRLEKLKVTVELAALGTESSSNQSAPSLSEELAEEEKEIAEPIEHMETTESASEEIQTKCAEVEEEEFGAEDVIVSQKPISNLASTPTLLQPVATACNIANTDVFTSEIDSTVDHPPGADSHAAPCPENSGEAEEQVTSTVEVNAEAAKGNNQDEKEGACSLNSSNNKELSEGECSSSESDQEREIRKQEKITTKLRKKNKKNAPRQEEKVSPNLEKKNVELDKTKEKESREIIEKQADILKKIEHLNKAAAALYNKPYPSLNTTEKEWVQDFASVSDFSPERVARFSKAAGLYADIPSPLHKGAPPASKATPSPVQGKATDVSKVADSLANNVLFPTTPPQEQKRATTVSPLADTQKTLLSSPSAQILQQEKEPSAAVPMDLELDSSPSKSHSTTFIAAPVVPEPLPLSPLAKNSFDHVLCKKCHQYGHRPSHCQYRTAAGIPRSYLVPCEANSPGVMISSAGTFVRYKQYEEQEKITPPEIPEPAPTMESVYASFMESAVIVDKEGVAKDGQDIKEDEPEVVNVVEPKVPKPVQEISMIGAVDKYLYQSLADIAEKPLKLKPEPKDVANQRIYDKAAIISEFLLHGKNDQLWIKLTVHNSDDISREFLLGSLLKMLASSTLNFVPVCFHRSGSSSVFFARDCSEAIAQCLRMNLVFTLPGRSQQYKMEIEIGTNDKNLTPFATNSLVFEVVRKRVLRSSQTLDLSEFHRSPELVNYCFFPLSLPKNLLKVLHYAKLVSKTAFTSVNLAGNNLESVRYIFEGSYFNYVANWDLGNNKIQKYALKQIAAKFYVKELTLNGNPLCSQFETPSEYVKCVTGVFNNLLVLDGCTLSNIDSEASIFVCDPLTMPFLEQFLAQYFSIFDSGRRDLLDGLYHDNALFSLTCSFWEHQSSLANARLGPYLSMSRNVIRCSNVDKLENNLLKGKFRVLEYLKKFPATTHDCSSFKVDLSIFSEKYAKISVSGLFREADPSTSPRNFRRVFMLHNDSGVYSICNEMLFISNCSSAQNTAGQVAKETVPDKLDVFLNHKPHGKILSEEGKERVIGKLALMTEMKPEWCRRCLEDMEWDLRNSLIYFQQLYESKKVPGDAFDVDDKDTQNLNAQI